MRTSVSPWGQVIFEGAEHPAYLKYPDRWHHLLLGLAKEVREREQG
jgi:hypothetical protein